MINPNEDGITHINIYSKGKTLLGRLLSNFAVTPFTHPTHGKFQSVEGYWYWLLAESNPQRDKLRTLSGWRAKQFGRELQTPDWPAEKDTTFYENIYSALEAKLEATPLLQELLGKSTLPFEHYYVYGDKVIDVTQGKWLIEFWDNARRD